MLALVRWELALAGQAVELGRPLIALIEDDPLLRVPLAHGLQNAGFSVVAAASGAEGLSVLEDRHIDVALIDIVLPGRLSAIEMVKEALRRNPALKVVFTSGKPLPNELREIGPFLPKPFRLADVIEVLQGVVGGSIPPASAIDPATRSS
jgi:CheY-like chemotaxis protein